MHLNNLINSPCQQSEEHRNQDCTHPCVLCSLHLYSTLHSQCILPLAKTAVKRPTLPHCKKMLAIFPSPAAPGCHLTKLSLAGNIFYSVPHIRRNKVFFTIAKKKKKGNCKNNQESLIQNQRILSWTTTILNDLLYTIQACWLVQNIIIKYL